MSNREDGFYWIKCNHREFVNVPTIEIAMWEHEEWWFAGMESPVDAMVVVLSPRLEPPK